jgi:hypothetical protein
VTFEKVAQNVAQPCFCQNQYTNFAVETSSPKNLSYFCNFQKLLKVSTRPIGENSPNLVTMLVTLLGLPNRFVMATAGTEPRVVASREGSRERGRCTRPEGVNVMIIISAIFTNFLQNLAFFFKPYVKIVISGDFPKSSAKVGIFLKKNF